MEASDNACIPSLDSATKIIDPVKRGTAQGERPGGAGPPPPTFVVKKKINLVKYTSKNEK